LVKGGIVRSEGTLRPEGAVREDVLTRRVCGLTAALIGIVAVGSWLASGAQEAVGAVVGGAVTVANFLWLRWTAHRALDGTAFRPGAGPWRRALWLAASGARFGVVALALGVLVALGWVGLTGLVVSLTVLPVTVIVAGVRDSGLG
jgi:hypothetical protein